MKSLENKLIIIGSTLPYSFSADYIKQTAKTLAKKNKVIIFFWGDALSFKEILKQKKKIKIIQRKKNIILFNPIHLLPWRRFETIRQSNLKLNILLLKLYLKSKKFLRLKKIAWVFNYELYNFPKFLGKSYLSLYDCVELPSSVNKQKEIEIRIKEKKLLQNTHLCFVNSQTLQKYYYKYKTHIVPQGFALNIFKKNQLPKKPFFLPKNKPLIGYIGGINFRLDFKLLYKLVKNNSQWNFVFVGPDQKNKIEDNQVRTQYWLKKLRFLKNIYLTGAVNKKQIPNLIKQFDVCLIPYNIKHKFNLYCYPMKIFEYFYIGKPVVSTPIKSLIPLQPYVKIAKDSKEISLKIAKILKNGWPKKYVKQQKQLAVKNSWQAKIEKISEILKKEFPEKFND